MQVVPKVEILICDGRGGCLWGVKKFSWSDEPGNGGRVLLGRSGSGRRGELRSSRRGADLNSAPLPAEMKRPALAPPGRAGRGGATPGWGSSVCRGARRGRGELGAHTCACVHACACVSAAGGSGARSAPGAAHRGAYAGSGPGPGPGPGSAAPPPDLLRCSPPRPGSILVAVAVPAVPAARTRRPRLEPRGAGAPRSRPIPARPAWLPRLGSLGTGHPAGPAPACASLRPGGRLRSGSYTAVPALAIPPRSPPPVGLPGSAPLAASLPLPADNITILPGGEIYKFSADHVSAFNKVTCEGRGRRSPLAAQTRRCRRRGVRGEAHAGWVSAARLSAVRPRTGIPHPVCTWPG
ncbi:PREDICTED: transcription initiation factor TFIID subunit 4-like [Chinchilla lanigera]|uniref:transcription initiation factor TFIID subunit 4-like n=1 Tax=Chinchilla lanigera TaxID=34839 RepID=UPI000697336E|nr:PREDICTED: transcription initiation factor TFIID subunit 4-like [Chinchilla lanigera]